jgi:hypothetical protein
MDGSRASVDDTNYEFNRIKLSSDRKNEICSQIADSTDSLPLWNAHNRTDSIASETNIVDSSDVATPMPKANPMENEAVTNAATKDAVGQLGVPLKTSKSSNNGLSRATTQTEETEDGKQSGAKKGDRPGTLRRLTTKIKRTISHNP